MSNEIIKSKTVYKGNFVNVRLDTVKVAEKTFERDY